MKETKDNEDYESLKLENQLCFPLYASARKMTGMYARYLKPLGITYTQYIVFLVLWENDAVTVGELCKKLYLDSGTVTPLLKKMEEKGFIIRMRCPDDERCVNIRLTDKGRQLREKAVKIPSEICRGVGLEKEEADQLYDLLYKFLDTLCRV